MKEEEKKEEGPAQTGHERDTADAKEMDTGRLSSLTSKLHRVDADRRKVREHIDRLLADEGDHHHGVEAVVYPPGVDGGQIVTGDLEKEGALELLRFLEHQLEDMEGDLLGQVRRVACKGV